MNYNNAHYYRKSWENDIRFLTTEEIALFTIGRMIDTDEKTIHTSSGVVFALEDWAKAIQYEIDWLNKEAD